MSKFCAIIIDIQNHDSINIVSFKAGDFTLSMMSLELDESITVGTEVVLGVKASSVAIAKEFVGELSYANQLDLEIQEIQEGELLCALVLKAKDFELESIITKASKRRMKLQVSDSVTALIKSSDLFIVEVL
ncbi:transporter [Sulfurimonas sp. SAG-AH-194-C20]|nr:TOBE domain-containing protein [Sulfurimonas sp. SAG-AH-194-C20]MDF1878339.1 transporter [Sulfurimonas sp. SAG-AH-194-C20]